MKKFLIICFFCCSFFVFGQRPNPSYEHKTITGDETVVFTFKVKPPVIARNLRIRDQSTSSGVKSINHNFRVNTNDEVTVNISIQLSNSVNEGNYYFEIDFTGDYQQHYYEHYGCKITREEQPVDSDGDGLSDNEDRCPNQAGPASNNGCPISDSDGDGIPDDQDNCPNQAGPASNNGCPLPDYDNDGVADTVDRCPTQIGNEAYNGCPHPENSVYRTRGQKETACKNVEVRGDTGTPVGTQQIYSQTIIAGEKIQVFPSTSRKITWLRIDPDLCDYSPIPTQSARIANVEETIKDKEEKVSIVEPAKVSTIAIAPNPVTNGQFTLQLNLEQASDVQITLYNFSGNRVQSIPSKLYGKGQHTIPVKVNRLRSGQYIVKVTTAEGIVSKHLIIK